MYGSFTNTSFAKWLSATLRPRWGAPLAVLFGLMLTSPVLAIVGPARLAPEFSPYAVMILNRDEGSYCTASVIAQDIVLTAAHCVSGRLDTQVFYRGGESKQILLAAAWIAWVLVSVLFAVLANRFGRVRTSAALQAGLSLVLFGSALAFYLWPSAAARLVFLDVAAIAVNPGYSPNTGQDTVSIDLALVRLAKPLPSSFKAVELLHDFPVEIGQPLRLVGYGHADEVERGTSGFLRTAVLAVSGPKSPFVIRLTDPEGTGLGGCTGDSGGPVFTVGRPALVAVAIRAKGIDGYACGAVTEAVLAGPQWPWIHKVLQAWGATENAGL